MIKVGDKIKINLNTCQDEDVINWYMDNGDELLTVTEVDEDVNGVWVEGCPYRIDLDEIIPEVYNPIISDEELDRYIELDDKIYKRISEIMPIYFEIKGINYDVDILSYKITKNEICVGVDTYEGIEYFYLPIEYLLDNGWAFKFKTEELMKKELEERNKEVERLAKIQKIEEEERELLKKLKAKYES